MLQGYEGVQVVVCAQEESIAPIFTAVEKLGIKKMKVCNSLDSMAELLEDNIIDVLVCDYSLLGERFLEMAQSIRKDAQGRNPFVIVIAAFDSPDADTVKDLINVGVDDLLRMPISSERLTRGIEGFTRSRKPFVASYNYVGPTRREPLRDTAEPGSLIYVPNTLRSKVVERMTDAELQRMVDVARIELEDKQSESRASELHDLATYVLQLWEADVNNPEIPPLIETLSELAEDFHNRNESSAAPQIGNLMSMLLLLLSRIRANGVESAAKEMRLLGNLTRAVRRALTTERDAIDLMGEIVETVARHTATH